MTTLARVVVFCVALFTASTAVGADPDALFRDAQTAYAAGDFERAAGLFAQADQLKPSANTKFNAAQSWRRAGRRAQAADAYASAIADGGLDEAELDTSRRKLAELERVLGQLVVPRREGRITIAHAKERSLPARIHLEPGSYQAAVTARGKRWMRRVEIVAGETLRVELDEPRPPPPRPAPAAVPEPAGPSPTWVGGWVALGVSAAGGIAAIALGARFLVVLDRYEETQYLDTSLEDEALALRTATNVVAFSSLAVAVAGAALLLTAPEANLSLRIGQRIAIVARW